MLPREFSSQVLLLLFGRFISDFGRGFSAAFAPIYFSLHVGLSTSVIALGVLASALMMGVAVFVGAYFTDRYGRKASLMASMLGSTVANLLFPWANGAISFVLVSLLSGSFLALYWPASTAMLTDLCPRGQRARMFAWLRIAVNAGVGLGMLGGGILLTLLEGVTLDPALPYKLLFLIDAGSYLVFFFILYFGIRETLPEIDEKRYEGFRKGWSEALSDRGLLLLGGLNICFALCYALFLLGFQIFFANFLGMTSLEISLALALNTAAIVLLQIPIWSLVNAWRRTRTLSLAALLFAGGLLVLLFCAWLRALALVFVCLSMVLYAFAEMLHGPAATSLFGNMAPLHLRGTYMSVETLSWAVGLALGPMLTGAFFDAGSPYLLWIVLAALVSSTIAGWRALERRLPASVLHAGDEGLQASDES